MSTWRPAHTAPDGSIYADGFDAIVLVAIPEGVTLAKRYSDRSWSESLDGINAIRGEFRDADVLGWQPLPDAPKEKTT